jgi:hypothetical protein
MTNEEQEEVNTFVDVGEYGLAFETLCAILDENQTPISGDIYILIEEIGQQMKYEPHAYEPLKNLTDLAGR